MKKLLASITAILLVVICANAQTGSIHGKVYDDQAKSPLEDAQIVLQCNSLTMGTCNTDEKGYYEFKSYNPGKYSLSIFLLGYQKVTIEVIIKADQATDQAITYLPKLQAELKQVEVVTTKRTEQLKQGEIGEIHTSNAAPVQHERTRSLNKLVGSTAGVYSKSKRSNSYSTNSPKVQTYQYTPPTSVGAHGNQAGYYNTGRKHVGVDSRNDREKDKGIRDSITDETSGEGYNTLIENPFVPSHKNLLSTFSIDVDRAGYSNMRRYIAEKQLPPKDAVRTEELLNYFNYNYPQPADDQPFSITNEIGDCPWNKDHKLLHIGLQGKIIPLENIPPMNLVFLIDVSGSMMSPNKLPLVKESLKMLVAQLREQDRISMVVYAGNAGLVLPPTSGADKNKIIEALNKLEAGGSTAGGAGINQAYSEAQKSFIKEGNNRVILCTDGDFNVGVSSDAELQKLIEEKRTTGIFLSVLGFGRGNIKDNHMETLADKGNGNYAYIDKLEEAKKVMVHEIGGTLYTIAKDVKIQLEFNPMYVKEYRLIGYENRKLNNEDFENDAIDAGDLGSGHNVTALYEIVPNLDKSERGVLKYDASDITPSKLEGDEWLYVKLRYKLPNEDKSKLIVTKVSNSQMNNVTDNFYFSAAVAEFAMLLHSSKYLGTGSFKQVQELASGHPGTDPFGYKKEFLDLVKTAGTLSGPPQAVK